MPANVVDLCLSSTVAGDLGVTDDARLQRCVTAASRAIARYCGRSFERSTLTEYPAGYGRPMLLLERAPVVSITSITEQGVTVDATTYESIGALANAAIVFRKDGVWLNTGTLSGRVTYSPDINAGRTDGIVVVYVGGYVTPGQRALDGSQVVTLPEDVQEAAALVAGGLYRRQTVDPNLASEGLGDWNVSYRAALPSLVLPEVEAILAPYRTLRVS